MASSSAAASALALAEERMEKMTRYETFLNEKLKKDLFAVMKERDSVWEEEAEYLKLKTVIERISASPSIEDGLKAKVMFPNWIFTSETSYLFLSSFILS